MGEIRINLNEHVKVKLTEFGKNIYYHQYDELNAKHGGQTIEPRMPEVDSEGYTRLLLWKFMNIYGKHISLGSQNVINPLEIVWGDNE